MKFLYWSLYRGGFHLIDWDCRSERTKVYMDEECGQDQVDTFLLFQRTDVILHDCTLTIPVLTTNLLSISCCFQTAKRILIH